MKNRWLPEIPENYYLYAGEVPWCNLFAENEWSDLEFTDGQESDHANTDLESQVGPSEDLWSKLLIFGPKLRNEVRD